MLDLLKSMLLPHSKGEAAFLVGLVALAVAGKLAVMA